MSDPKLKPRAIALGFCVLVHPEFAAAGREIVAGGYSCHMQLLTSTRKAPSKKDAKAALTASQLAIAAIVMTSVPPVMWFIRRQVGKYKARGLSVTQYRVLCVIGRDAGISLSDVAENLGIGLPMVSRVVLKLSERGYLKVVACEDDRRRKKLALTKAGQSVVDASQEHIRQAIAERLVSLGPPQHRQIKEALELLQSLCSPTASQAYPS